MDFILQKFVELGGTEITPIIAVRCNVRLSHDRWQKKITRWQKIIISACEQCGRNILPRINLPVRFMDFVAQDHSEAKVILDPAGENDMSSVDIKPNVAVMIGPEGGFNEEEIEQAKEHNFLNVKLGPRILRVETAGIAIISILQFLFGF